MNPYGGYPQQGYGGAPGYPQQPQQVSGLVYAQSQRHKFMYILVIPTALKGCPNFFLIATL